MPPMPEPVLPALRVPFRAIATTVVPEAATLDATQWAALEGIVEDALARRPARMRRQLALLIRLIEHLPLLWSGRRFSGLAAVARTRLLVRLQNAPVLLLRRGVWGLRTLVLMGYYARSEAAASIGYRADPRGWDARR